MIGEKLRLGTLTATHSQFGWVITGTGKISNHTEGVDNPQDSVSLCREALVDRACSAFKTELDRSPTVVPHPPVYMSPLRLVHGTQARTEMAGDGLLLVSLPRSERKADRDGRRRPTLGVSPPFWTEGWRVEAAPAGQQNRSFRVLYCTGAQVHTRPIYDGALPCACQWVHRHESPGSRWKFAAVQAIRSFAVSPPASQPRGGQYHNLRNRFRSSVGSCALEVRTLNFESVAAPSHPIASRDRHEDDLEARVSFRLPSKWVPSEAQQLAASLSSVYPGSLGSQACLQVPASLVSPGFTASSRQLTQVSSDEVDVTSQILSHTWPPRSGLPAMSSSPNALATSTFNPLITHYASAAASWRMSATTQLHHRDGLISLSQPSLVSFAMILLDCATVVRAHTVKTPNGEYERPAKAQRLASSLYHQ